MKGDKVILMRLSTNEQNSNNIFNGHKGSACISGIFSEKNAKKSGPDAKKHGIGSH